MSKIVFSLVALVTFFMASAASAAEEVAKAYTFTTEDCKNAYASQLTKDLCAKQAAAPLKAKVPFKKRFVPPVSANIPACTPEEIAVHWEGDEGGLVVRVERKAQAAISNGQLMYGCVATRASVIALWKLFKDLEGRVTGLENWKKAFDGAVDSKGQPAPLTVQNWILVWERVNWLLDRVGQHEAQLQNHEGRIKKVEETTCRLVEGVWVNCPDLEANRLDFDFSAGVRTTYFYRPSLTDSGAIGFDAMFTLWKGNAGAYVGGTGGWSLNDDRQRFSTDARLGFAYGGLCDPLGGEHPCVLRIGGVAHAEPIVQFNNDAFGIAGEVGVDLRPGGGPFGIGFALQVGANRAAQYGRFIRVVSRTEVFFAPSLVLSLYPF